MVPKDKVLSALRGRADHAYCDYIRQMQQDDCLGEEFKIASGAFGRDELNAHCKAHEHLGRHRALVEAANVFNEMISAAPAAPAEARDE